MTSVSARVESQQRATLIAAFPNEWQAHIGRFRERLRDHRFWLVQAMVLAITALHILIEADALFGGQDALMFIPASLYLIPITYAALNFGIDGALPTAIWSALLAVPNMILWHSGAQNVGEGLHLGTVTVLSVVIARRVDRETQAKQTAEEVSGRLARLNATATAIGRSLDPESVVGDTLETILGERRLDLAWIAFGTGCCPEFPLVTVRTKSGEVSHALPPARDDLTRAVLDDGQARPDAFSGVETGVSDVMIAPIRGTDAVLGALGVASHERSLTADDMSLLDAVSHQLAVALDNVHHYHEERRAFAELQQAQQRLVAYLRLATNAQEEERKRLARELHDDTLQSLVVIKGNIDSLGANGRSQPSKAQLAALQQMMDAAVENVRRFSRDLRPSVLDDLGLVHAIDWLLKETSRRAAIVTRLEQKGDVPRLGDETEVAVFRIVQEALRNVERHSGAGSVTVTLAVAKDSFAVGVADDGRGFDATQVLGTRDDGVGLGLVGMQERAKLIGATLRIASQPGKGTRIALSLTTAGHPGRDEA